MNEKIYDIAFQLILNAGNSKSNSMLAIAAAKENNFYKADELIEKAQNDLHEAHQIQTDLIQSEARGEKNEINLIFVHAQDHLTMALMTIDFAKETISIYKELFEMKALLKERG